MHPQPGGSEGSVAAGGKPSVFIFVIASLTLVFGTRTLFADVVALTPSKDNTLYEDATGSVSNGAGSAMYSGRNSASTNSIRRALVEFDVAGQIPADATIQSATLTLNNSASNVDEAIVTLHRLLSDWGEGASVAGGGGGSGGPVAAGDATWLHSSYDTQFWATPGGDFDAVISASAVVEGPGEYSWASTPQLVADLQMFLDVPASNHGWILLGDESAPGTAKKFATPDTPDLELQPVLTVTYVSVPEPGVFSMLCAIVFLTSRDRGNRRR